MGKASIKLVSTPPSTTLGCNYVRSERAQSE